MVKQKGQDVGGSKRKPEGPEDREKRAGVGDEAGGAGGARSGSFIGPGSLDFNGTPI